MTSASADFFAIQESEQIREDQESRRMIRGTFLYTRVRAKYGEETAERVLNDGPGGCLAMTRLRMYGC